MEGHLVVIFGVLGMIVSIMVYLAPLFTFKKIYKKKSTEEQSVLPYVVTLFSSAIWFYYGKLRSNAITLVSINGVGCAIEMVYIILYFYYSVRHDRICTTIILCIFASLFCIITFITYFTWRGDMRIEVVGWVCLAASISVYASTIGTMVRAVRTRSVRSIPITLTCVLTVNAFIWGIYGYAKEDANIWIPNTIGLFLGVAHISVYFICRKQQEKTETVREPSRPTADV